MVTKIKQESYVGRVQKEHRVVVPVDVYELLGLRAGMKVRVTVEVLE